MGKKRTRKHQKETNESTHSSDEEKLQDNTAVRSCPHVMKSVSINGIKKLFKGSVNFGMCQSCVKNQASTASDESKDDDAESITLLCLQCGNQGCGQFSKYQHALTHYQTPRSDKHSLVINTATWNVWCYECDDEIYVESNKKLLECVNFLQKQAGLKKPENISTVKTPSLESSQENATLNDNLSGKEQSLNGLGHSKSKLAEKQEAIDNKDLCDNKKNVKLNTSKLPQVRGLSNLGNTCFFNAIIQNLIQTHLLVHLMTERHSKGTSTYLPGIQHDSSFHSDAPEFRLEPLEIFLPECGALTHALIGFFKDITAKGKTGTVNPSPVFEQICKKAPQFRGAKQQDSHELLRHLLDGLRTEETRRQRIGILQAFNLPSKVDPDTVDEETKTKIKAYGRQANHTIIDNIFSGQLISTVWCKECQVSSQVFEPFLDLSLPIAEEKSLALQPLRPGLHRKPSGEALDITPQKANKYTERRAKRKAKKEAKRTNKHRSKSNDDVSYPGLKEAEILFSDQTPGVVNDNISEQSDADVEDNAESETTISSKIRKHSISSQTDVEKQTIEENGNLIDDSHEEITNAPYGNNKIDEICNNVQNMKIKDKLETDGLGSMDDPVGNCLGADAKKKREEEKSEPPKSFRWKLKEEWIAKSLTTLDARYQPNSHECSVLSCLNQFTAPELLTGNNKFGCENCTKLHMNKTGHKSEGKTTELVYSNASKQLLIFSPPAVLTLHLKRFQQVGFTLRKVNRHVDFPLILDLAPYCSSVCLGLPNMSKGQRHVLYSLYGVAEHSGRLTSGHYTAYVKVRAPNLESRQKFLNLKPAGQYEINKLIAEMSKKAKSIDELQHPEPNNGGDEIPTFPSAGKWYHISDTYVAEVSEQTVLQSQAYILFYERIL